MTWINPKTEAYPPKNTPVFIKTGIDIQIAIWNPEIREWYNTTFGRLPPIYDDSGGEYSPYVHEWAYIPKDLFES